MAPRGSTVAQKVVHARSEGAGAVVRRPRPKRSQTALLALDRAERHDQLAEEADGPLAAFNERSHAKAARAEGEALLAPAAPTGRLVSGAGEALEVDRGFDGNLEPVPFTLVDTLQRPTSVSVEASGRRLHAALNAQVLEPAMDAAESAGADNSIEKMLCHQMAGAHFTGMRLLELVAKADLPPVEIPRITNAAARMMDVYQGGCVTLQKLKTHGQQRVLVQYQQVSVANDSAMLASAVSSAMSERSLSVGVSSVRSRSSR
jgi:hypothetical protein